MEKYICGCGDEMAWDEVMCEKCFRTIKELNMDDRKKFIGGSDVAALMGLSRWKTPLQLWAEKTGKVEPKDLSDNEACELGTELEDFIAKKFERRTGMAVRRAPKRYIHPDYHHFSCQVDRLITKTDELLECKNFSAWRAKEFEGEDVPIEVVLQVQWQLFITGRSAGWVAVLLGGQRFIYKKIDADEELIMKMVKSAEDFWKMVLEETPPLATSGDDEVLVRLYPQSNDVIKEASCTLNSTLRYYLENNMHIKDFETEQKILKAKIMQVIGDNKGLMTDEYKVLRIDMKECEYTVKRNATWFPRIYKLKEAENGK
jgi:putative phage-type endonuclease